VVAKRMDGREGTLVLTLKLKLKLRPSSWRRLCGPLQEGEAGMGQVGGEDTGEGCRGV
jgi:hypothetical protein